MSGAVAVSEWTLREPTTGAALTRIARAGFSCVELGGATPDISAARRALRGTGLRATSICPLLGPRLDLASTDATIRGAAVDAVRRWVELAVDVGAATVIVVPSDRPDGEGSGAAYARAAVSLHTIAADLGPEDPRLVIEPLNRYETHLVHTLDQAAQLCALTECDTVRLMGDTFHMGIEEDDPLGALTDNADRLAHLHLADNQRRAPGTGSLNFTALRRLLDELGFVGTVALECLPCSDHDLRIAARTLIEAGWTL